MRGAPKDFSMTTLRPLGPRVTFTASASVSTPRSMRVRASVANTTSFAAISQSPVSSIAFLLSGLGDFRVGDDAENVAFFHDQQLVAVNLDLGARPFAE